MALEWSSAAYTPYWHFTTRIVSTGLPAPTYVAGDLSTGELIVHAWIYNYNNTAIITWPESMNETVQVLVPEGREFEFKRHRIYTSSLLVY